MSLIIILFVWGTTFYLLRNKYKDILDKEISIKKEREELNKEINLYHKKELELQHNNKELNRKTTDFDNKLSILFNKEETLNKLSLNIENKKKERENKIQELKSEERENTRKSIWPKNKVKINQREENINHFEICPYCWSNNVSGKWYRWNSKRLKCKNCNKSRSIDKDSKELLKPRQSKSDFWFKDGEKSINITKKNDILNYKVEANKGLNKGLNKWENKEDIVLDKDQQYVYNRIIEWKNIFLTWKAWTGKSMIVKKLINQNNRLLIPLAPTWIAAINLDWKWQTLHSFFSIPLDITVDNIYKKLDNNEIHFKTESIDLLKKCDWIMIDEISMVRSDMFDILDILCKYLLNLKKPFWWKQIVCIWDLYQLPPILKWSDRFAFSHKYKSEFFFWSNIFNKCLFEITN